VTAVVLHYRELEDTARCVRSLQSSDYRNLDIIVVDNGGEPSSPGELRSVVDSRIPVIESGSNLGYAGGNNLGIAVALEMGSEYVWVVNPDLIVESNTLTAMMAAARRHPDAGCIGSRILLGPQHPTRVWFDGGRIDWSSGGAATHINAGVLAAKLPPQGVRPVDYVTGASLLIKAMVFGEIGLLPEDYFLYFEETDFCVRARRRGWSAIIATDVVAWHYKRSSNILPAPYYLYYWPRGRALFSQRYCGEVEVAEYPDFINWRDGWRRSVERHAPSWLGEFDRLVNLGLTDGRMGRTGPRRDIETVEPPVAVATPVAQ